GNHLAADRTISGDRSGVLRTLWFVLVILSALARVRNRRVPRTPRPGRSSTSTSGHKSESRMEARTALAHTPRLETENQEETQTWYQEKKQDLWTPVSLSGGLSGSKCDIPTVDTDAFHRDITPCRYRRLPPGHHTV
ncbi:hypothetical protein P7K49_003270, partial [Saguinus oedipus]